ncbi:retrovirus-related pol polyprotein from transposon TNT 1-94, partial [Tanacetum coccineum]
MFINVSRLVDLLHPNKVYIEEENGFKRGTIDKTLFIKKNKSDIMLVQVYVDDIIFESTKKSMCTEFEECMHKRFQMSSMGKLAFFLGLQVKQQPDGIFISQDKYVADILKKFDFLSIRTVTTPIESNTLLVKDEDGVDEDVHVYRSMIGSLMYLTASRPNIMDSPFELEAYSDSDYGGASLDRKSTTEASIRSDLLFDDVDGIDSLNNQAIFDTIQLMGNQLKDVPVPLDHFPVPTLTKKVLTFMVKMGKNFSGKVTPLFDSMLVQQIEDEGDVSERPSDSPPIPSPPHPSEDQPQIQPDPSPRPSPTSHIPDSIPEGFGGNHRGQSSNDASLSGNEDGLTLQSVYDLCVSLCKQVTAQAKEIKDLKAQVKKLKKGVKPLITHHKAWMKTRLARKNSIKKKGVHKEYVSKQGRKYVKTFKGEPSVHKDPAFDDLNDFVDVDDTLDYMETEDVQDERRNEGTKKGNEGTDKGNEGTDKQDGGTDSIKVSTDRQGEGTTDQNEGKSVTQIAPTPTPTTPTPTIPTPTVFGDDETIAQVLIIMSQNKEKLKEKEKGVEIRNVEETERPRPTSTRSILTLRPLPKID